jgi:hypothetical protein
MTCYPPMSFRQPKSHRHDHDRAWRAWLSRYESALKAVGLPPSLTLNEDHWTDFLQNGYLEWHPESNDGYVFDQMSAQQMSQLLAVLEASPEYVAQPMVGWLRCRLGRAAAG